MVLVGIRSHVENTMSFGSGCGLLKGSSRFGVRNKVSIKFSVVLQR
jgi:hypothetical protein